DHARQNVKPASGGDADSGEQTSAARICQRILGRAEKIRPRRHHDGNVNRSKGQEKRQVHVSGSQVLFCTAINFECISNPKNGHEWRPLLSSKRIVWLKYLVLCRC